MQCLYEFKGADSRFLTLADTLWSPSPFLISPLFEKTTMKTSFRITDSIRSFINNVLLGEPRMSSCRDGPPVQYIRNSRYFIENIVIAEIFKLFEEGAKPQDIFILAPSVKGTMSHIRKMENRFVEKGIPCHIPMLENEKIDERVIQGKVVFSTFHSVKGRQRKYVFIMGFDNSYFDIYSRNIPRTICPNTIYVGTTRASHGLYLLENSDYDFSRPLEFLQMNHIDMGKTDYIHFRGIPKIYQMSGQDNPFQKKMNIEFFRLTPTDMIKFLSDSTLEIITPIIEKIFHRERETPGDVIDIPTVIQTRNGGFEEVSDINGIAIPAFYYDSLRGENHDIPFLLEIIEMKLDHLKSDHHLFLRERTAELPRIFSGIQDYLYASNISLSLDELLYFKLHQIHRDEYTWITQDIIQLCMKRIHDTIPINNLSCPLMEKVIIHEETDYSIIDSFFRPHFGDKKRFRFHARTDLITEDTIWELKCTSQITLDHQLQLVIYAWLWYMTGGEEKMMKIFNIKTGEVSSLNASKEELDVIILTILNGKYKDFIRKTDEEFCM
jgi:hypothetical protein